MEPAGNKASDKVSHYIEGLPEWSQTICKLLRAIILEADETLKEEWKWGPHYSSNGMVCGYGAFQKHVKLTFFNGSAMGDEERAFNHCVDNEFSRSIKFVTDSGIKWELLTAYIRESVRINQKGFKRVIPNKEVLIPEELRNALQVNKAALHFFHSLSYGYKKDFVAYVTSAKQEKTKLARIGKVVLLAEGGRTLNEQYQPVKTK